MGKYTWSWNDKPDMFLCLINVLKIYVGKSFIHSRISIIMFNIDLRI